MKETKITSERFSDFTRLVDKLMTDSDQYIFRGMASPDWRLQTSIDRFLGQLRKTNSNPMLSDTNQNTFAEYVAQAKFLKNQSQNLNRLFGRSTNDDFLLDNSNFLHMPIILQHYGYPTRIQDWTENWKIALYFCLEDPKETGDICIWSLKSNKIPDVEACLDNPSFLYPADMFENNQINSFYHRLKVGIYRVNKGFFKRIAAQNGIALTTGRADYTDFQQHLEECPWISEEDIRKFIIDANLRSRIRNYLDSEGITYASLYPKDITDGYVDTDKASIEKFMNEMYPDGFLT